MKVSVLSFFFLLSISSAVLLISVHGDPTKSVWPIQFDVPFGLDCILPPIHNATSHLYYDWTIKSQALDYPERCFPFAHWDSGFHPCTLFFNPQGVYLAAPAIGLDCCLFVDGVGAVPPSECPSSSCSLVLVLVLVLLCFHPLFPFHLGFH
jgi:hypothetical protein